MQQCNMLCHRTAPSHAQALLLTLHPVSCELWRLPAPTASRVPRPCCVKVCIMLQTMRQRGWLSDHPVQSQAWGRAAPSIPRASGLGRRRPRLLLCAVENILERWLLCLRRRGSQMVRKADLADGLCIIYRQRNRLGSRGGNPRHMAESAGIISFFDGSLALR